LRIDEEGDYSLFSYYFILESFENIKLRVFFIKQFIQADNLAIKGYIKYISNTKKLSEHIHTKEDQQSFVKCQGLKSLTIPERGKSKLHEGKYIFMRYKHETLTQLGTSTQAHMTLLPVLLFL